MQYSDLSKNKNNFEKYDHIESFLFYGNPVIDINYLLTICIPTYNRPKLLKEAILSAKNQRNVSNNYKILVVDNDEGAEVTEAQKVIEKMNDPDILYYKNKKNIGMFGNINRCLQLAKTPYVSLLHDDDLLKNDYVHEISKYLSSKKRIDCISVSFDFLVDQKGVGEIIGKKTFFSKIKNKLKRILGRRLYRIPDLDNYYLHRNIFGPPTCGMVFKRMSFIKSGGFNDEYYPTSDWFFMIYFNRKFNVYRIQNILASYRWEQNESLRNEVIEKFHYHEYEIIKCYSEKTKIYLKYIQQQSNKYYREKGIEFAIDDRDRTSPINFLIFRFFQHCLNMRYLQYRVEAKHKDWL